MHHKSVLGEKSLHNYSYMHEQALLQWFKTGTCELRFCHDRTWFLAAFKKLVIQVYKLTCRTNYHMSSAHVHQSILIHINTST